jgi:hypothetical protein
MTDADEKKIDETVELLKKALIEAEIVQRIKSAAVTSTATEGERAFIRRLSDGASLQAVNYVRQAMLILEDM